MRSIVKLACAILGLSALGGCSETTALSALGQSTTPIKETIAWSVGPCFGYCPVYKVEVDGNGTVRFVGERHTAVLGRKAREGGPDAYRAIETALAPYRPSTGASTSTICEQQVSDSSSYVFSWTRSDGTVTTLKHDKGCLSPRNIALNTALQTLPRQLGVEDWMSQVTRPGDSRGQSLAAGTFGLGDETVGPQRVGEERRKTVRTVERQKAGKAP